jgi:hypothetical protein
VAGATRDEVLREVERSVGAALGAPPQARASTSFVGVEPIEVLRFAGADSVSLLTLGMSARPMGDESQGATARAELLAEIHGGGGDLWRRLAVLAAAPVVEGVIYSAGMTVDLATSLDSSSICTGGVIVESALHPVSTAAGEVAILRFVPATATELAFSRVHGSSELRRRWDDSGTDLLDIARSSVDLG